MEADEELVVLGDKWFAITSLSKDPHSMFRTGLLKLAYSYSRLSALSFGLQHTFRKNNTDENPFVHRVSQLTHFNIVGRVYPPIVFTRRHRRG